MSSIIPCDFCRFPLERERSEGIKVSARMPDSCGDPIVSAQFYYFGHAQCIRTYYHRLFELKIVAAASPSTLQ